MATIFGPESENQSKGWGGDGLWGREEEGKVRGDGVLGLKKNGQKKGRGGEKGHEAQK